MANHMSKHTKPNNAESNLSRQNLFDFYWLQERLATTTVAQLLQDFAPFENVYSLQLIKQVLRLSANVLVRDKSALGTQLFGRLHRYEIVEIQGLLAQIERDFRSDKKQVWLRPLTQSLTSPSDPLRYTLFENEEGSPQAMTITPDGKYLITAREKLQLWDLTLPEDVITLDENPPPLQNIVVTPDNQYIIGVLRNTRRTTYFRVWHLATQQDVTSEFPINYPLNMDSMDSELCISPDGRHFAFMQLKHVLLFDLLDEEEALVLVPPKGGLKGFQGINFTPDGNHIIAGTFDGTINMWNLQDRHEMTQLTGHKEWVRDIAVTADGRYAVSGSDDKALKVWDLKEKKEFFTLHGHTRSILSVAVAPDGQYAISSGWGKSLRNCLKNDNTPNWGSN